MEKRQETYVATRITTILLMPEMEFSCIAHSNTWNVKTAKGVRNRWKIERGIVCKQFEYRVHDLVATARTPCQSNNSFLNG